jgi:hypothetical protein
MMETETLSETTDTNSVFTWMITQGELIAFRFCLIGVKLVRYNGVHVWYEFGFRTSL